MLPSRIFAPDCRRPRSNTPYPTPLRYPVRAPSVAPARWRCATVQSFGDGNFRNGEASHSLRLQIAGEYARWHGLRDTVDHAPVLAVRLQFPSNVTCPRKPWIVSHLPVLHHLSSRLFFAYHLRCVAVRVQRYQAHLIIPLQHPIQAQPPAQQILRRASIQSFAGETNRTAASAHSQRRDRPACILSWSRSRHRTTAP